MGTMPVGVYEHILSQMPAMALLSTIPEFEGRDNARFEE